MSSLIPLCRPLYNERGCKGLTAILSMEKRPCPKLPDLVFLQQKAGRCFLLDGAEDFPGNSSLCPRGAVEKGSTRCAGHFCPSRRRTHPSQQPLALAQSWGSKPRGLLSTSSCSQGGEEELLRWQEGERAAAKHTWGVVSYCQCSVWVQTAEFPACRK